MQNISSTGEPNFIEKFGYFSLPFFVCGIGFVCYMIGSCFFLMNNWANFKFSSLLLLFLIFIPFTIQIPIFYKFRKVIKNEVRSGNKPVSDSGSGLHEFFKYYCWFMCVGLVGYSFSWLLYNCDLDKWTSDWLTGSSILSLGFIAVLIWIIGICTRVIISGGKNDGLLKPEDLTNEEYEKLCSRLNTIFVNEKFLEEVVKIDDDELRKIITTKKSDLGNLIRDKYKNEGKSEDELKKIIEAEEPILEKGQEQINEIAKVFLPLRNKKLPLESRRDSQLVDDIISLLTDRNQPVRIKPMKHILSLLKSSDNSINKAVKDRNIESVPKPQVIKSLNKILKNYKFYTRKDFLSGDDLTGVPSAKDFFEKNKDEAYLFPEHVIKENRRLFDVHILHTNLSEEAKHSPKHRVLEWIIALITFRWFFPLIKFGLNNYKERKIIEGIGRFPFPMLLFFFTIFICILYLFSFSFAFHNLSVLKDTQNKTKTPALFMEAAYPNLNTDSKKRSYKDSKTASDTDSNANQPGEKQSTFFFFYTLTNSGTVFKKDESGNQDMQNRRDVANKKNLDSLINELEDKSLISKKILVEIVGRTDDNPINSEEAASKMTYSSNFDLSLARAQNLKFALMRQLQNKKIDILEKVEWSCLPGSNDPSLSRFSPLDDSKEIPLLTLKDSTKNDTPPNNRGDPTEMVNNTNNEIAKIFPASQEPDDPMFIKRQSLNNNITNTLELFKESGESPNKISDLTKWRLAIKLQRTFTAYKAILDAPNIGLNPDSEDYKKREKEFDDLTRNIESALVFFGSESDNSNKRITEVYVTPIPYQEPSNRLNLMDYILYSLTTIGYADIKPTTLFAKFLSIFVCLVEIFFIVVFFNALLSVKRFNEEDGGVYSFEHS